MASGAMGICLNAVAVHQGDEALKRQYLPCGKAEPLTPQYGMG